MPRAHIKWPCCELIDVMTHPRCVGLMQLLSCSGSGLAIYALAPASEHWYLTSLNLDRLRTQSRSLSSPLNHLRSQNLICLARSRNKLNNTAGFLDLPLRLLTEVSRSHHNRNLGYPSLAQHLRVAKW